MCLLLNMYATLHSRKCIFVTIVFDCMYHAQELEALTGWCSAMCLLLEVNDVAAPLLHGLFGRLSAAASWLLTALIGRGLGLIFRGVRQCFRREKPPRPAGGDGGAQAAPAFA